MASPQLTTDGVGTRAHRLRLVFALFTVSLSSQAASPVLLYYTHELNLTPWMLTVFFAIYALGLVPVLLLGGPQSDRVGRRSVVVPAVAMVLVSVIAFELAAIWGTPALLVARFLQGITAGAVFTVGTVWLRELAGTHKAMHAAMLASGWMAAGFAIGPFITGFLVQWVPWPKIIPMLVPAILLIVANLLMRGIPETMTERRAGRIRVGVPADAMKGFLLFLLPVALLVYTPAMLTLTIFPVQIAQAGMTEIYVLTGVSLLLLQGSAAIAAVPSRRWGPARSGWLCALLCAIGCAVGYLAVQPGNWWLVLPASVLIGFSGGLGMTAGLMVSDLLAPPDRRGALVSMYYIVVYFGFMAPTIFGFVFGKGVLEQPGTIIAHVIGSLVILVIVAGAGLGVLRSRERQLAERA